MWKISKENCEDLGFAIICMFYDAINLSEFKLWLDIVVRDTPIDKIPLYIFDLIDFNGSFYELINIIGFTPDPNLTEDEDNAIYGIAIKRFGNDLDIPISNNEALRALDRNPLISKRFKSIFPFINFSY